MISERFFVKHYNGAWNVLLPMGEDLIRSINVDVERFSLEVLDRAPAGIRGLVNEFGFELARAAFERSLGHTSELDADIRLYCLAVANKRIAELDHLDPQTTIPLSHIEEGEAHEVGNSLLSFLLHSPPTGPVVFEPKFKGCGFVDSCLGDLIEGTTLCEVKAGSRNFRLADLRQLLTYATLNMLAPVASITHLALVNPRRGVFYRETFDAIAWAVSGRSASDLASAITDVMCGAGSSR